MDPTSRPAAADGAPPPSPPAASRPARATRAGLLFLIGFYQHYLRLHLFGNCRFQPTCSVYAQECITRFGAARGGWLALRRILRCRPFGPSGFDPPPASWSESKTPHNR